MKFTATVTWLCKFVCAGYDRSHVQTHVVWYARLEGLLQQLKSWHHMSLQQSWSGLLCTYCLAYYPFWNLVLHRLLSLSPFEHIRKIQKHKASFNRNPNWPGELPYPVGECWRGTTPHLADQLGTKRNHYMSKFFHYLHLLLYRFLLSINFLFKVVFIFLEKR